ncbi:EF-hand domain-containing protein [Pontibacter pamirensis]|uniref:hypothetical protein n=1 Tax=Pontibacter pamirensis TaxID=2562824 RepID=UPI0013898C90|nr:hypothetical protein [Pontibacter pamirensis]
MKENRTNIRKWSVKGLSLLLAAGMAACATGADADLGTGPWDSNEFNSTFASNDYYEDWDTNDDILLDLNEFNTGLYDTWDLNDDNQLDENEWNTASNDWGLENETWSEWDTTGDGFLDNNEFGTGFADSGWFNNWDLDNDSMLGEREFTDGLFGQWDSNADGILDDNEFGYYNTYFGI